MSEQLRDIDTVLDYIAGSTGGANRPMPSQLAASQAARRLRRALAAAPSTPEPVRFPVTQRERDIYERYHTPSTPEPGIDVERLADAIANVLPVPTMLDVDFAETTARDLLAEYARLASEKEQT